MKKILLSLFVALIAVTSVQAQQISVVSPSGGTTLYRTFQQAIEGAASGSIIYLPGGGFPISDDIKITKKLTIIGIGHYVKSGNVDGVTTISGNLWFNEGSSGSAVMGCYITGDVNIGDGDATVNDLLIRYCSLYSISVKNSRCSGIVINQNYIRNSDYWHNEFNNFGNGEITLKNNIVHAICNVSAGVIANNIFISSTSDRIYNTLQNVNNTSIIGNVLRKNQIHSGNNCQTSNNFVVDGSWGDDPIIIDGEIQDLFVNLNNWTISPTSDFHFTDAYKQYESKVGIYAGTGFNDKQMAPVPYIVAKHVDEQTDSSGKLNVKIRVKANQ